jgi:hypothetical protein
MEKDPKTSSGLQPKVDQYRFDISSVRPAATTWVNTTPPRSHLPLILTVSVITTLTGFVGFFLGKHLSTPRVVYQAGTTPTSVPTSMSVTPGRFLELESDGFTAVTEANDRKTYTNTHYGYSIKYPKRLYK